MQVRMISAKVHKERAVLLVKMCAACSHNQLRFNKDMMIVAALMDAVQTSIKEVRSGARERMISMEDLAKRAMEASLAYNKSSNLTISKSNDGNISRLIDNGQVNDVCRNALLLLGKIGGNCNMLADTSPLRKYYGDWQWSLLLMRYI